MKNKLKGPRTHTLTAVLDAILEDLVFSHDIVAQENIDPWRTGHRLANNGSFKQSTVEPCGAKVKLFLVSIGCSQTEMLILNPQSSNCKQNDQTKYLCIVCVTLEFFSVSVR